MCWVTLTRRRISHNALRKFHMIGVGQGMLFRPFTMKSMITTQGSVLLVIHTLKTRMVQVKLL